MTPITIGMTGTEFESAINELSAEVSCLADGDAHLLDDVVTTNGSPIITSATANFAADCVGKSIAISQGGGVDTKLRTTILSRQSATQVTLATNCLRTQTGAGAIYGTDFAPALQDALDGLIATGGGTLHISAGRRLLFTPILQSYLNLASHVHIKGRGSIFYVSMPIGEYTAIETQNVEDFVLEDVIFTGCPSEIEDAWITLHLVGPKINTLRNVTFVGLCSNQREGGAILMATQTSLVAERCQFNGCGGGSAWYNPTVMLDEFWSSVFHECRWLDHGQLEDKFTTKTGITITYAHVYLKDPFPVFADGFDDKSPTIFNLCLFDEGAIYSIYSLPITDRIFGVKVLDCAANITVASPGGGVYLNKVDSVVIDESWFGYTQTAGQFGVRITDCGNVEIRRTHCIAEANEIVIDSLTDSVLIEDCTYTTLTSACPDTRVVNRGRVISNKGATTIALGSDSALQVQATDSGPAFLSVNRVGHYATNFGIDTDNSIVIGGWDGGAFMRINTTTANATFPAEVRAERFVNSLATTQALVPSGNVWNIDSDSGVVYRNPGAAYAVFLTISSIGKVVANEYGWNSGNSNGRVGRAWYDDSLAENVFSNSFAGPTYGGWRFENGTSPIVARALLSGAGVFSCAGITLPLTTPASASATGTTGSIAWDANYIYICTATNTWKRVAIATW